MSAYGTPSPEGPVPGAELLEPVGGIGARVRGLTDHAAVRFVARRVVALVAQLFVVTVVMFALTNTVPADPVAANLSVEAQADPEVVAAYREKHGLDDSLPKQYLTYMGNLLHGDFGISMQTGNPIADDLRDVVPASFELAGAAMILAVVLGVGLGIVSGVRLLPRPLEALLNGWSLVALSIPVFWLALLAYYFLFYKAGIFPGGGRLESGAAAPPTVTGFYTIDALIAGQLDTFVDAVKHLIMPALVLAADTIALLMRFTSAAVRESMGNAYVRSARGQGLKEVTVILQYIVRPALLSIITVAGLAFGTLLSGTVLVESILNWPGLGEYAFRSTVALDLPAIVGVSIVIAGVFIVVNFFVDVCYVLIDPRLRGTTT